MECHFCEFTTDSNSHLVAHYVKKHKTEEGFELVCKLCSRSYHVPDSFLSHLKRKHNVRASAKAECLEPNPKRLKPSSSADPQPHTSCDDDPTSFEHEHEDEDEDVEHSEDDYDNLSEDDGEKSSESPEGGDGESFEANILSSGFEEHQSGPSEESATGSGPNDDMWNASKFLLHLREEAFCSQSAVESTIDGVNNLFTDFSEAIKNRVMEGMDPATLTVPQSHIEAVFTEFTSKGLFSGVETKIKLDEFLQDHCEVLKPIKVKLSERLIFDKNGQVKIHERYGYASPFLPSLKRLLSRPDVMKCVMNPLKEEKGVYRSYRDGKFCQTHPILSDPHALAIILYYDELEVSSPLGPRKHKIAMYYWTLANIHPHLNSSLRAINLLSLAMYRDLKVKQKPSLAPSLDLKLESHQKLLASFFDDILSLETSGVKVNVQDHGERTFQGTLYCVCGDTPGLGTLSGAKESVSLAHKPCQLCHGDHYEIKAIFDENFFKRRTKEDYAEQLATLHQSRTLKERMDNSTRCGLNGPSIVTSVSSFDHARCFVYDLMHILHEGVLEAHMRVLLYESVYIKECLTIEEVNHRMITMAEQCLSRDKPAPIDGDHLKTGLRQTASQMFNLALILPFILMDKASVLQKKLENFVLLLKISIGLMCYELRDEDIKQLKIMIQKHHETFMVDYPHFSITPKFHFLLHLLSQIMDFGPSRVTWTMRFEAMHAYFKNIIRICKNFKNPPYTCIYRYECLRAYQTLSKPGHDAENFLDRGMKFSGKSVKVKNHSRCDLLTDLFGSLGTVMSCSSLEYQGMSIRRGRHLLLSTSNELPAFGIISDIIVKDDMYIVIVCHLKTDSYVNICNAYKVSPISDPTYQFLMVENLIHKLMLPVVNLNGSNYIIPKHHRIGCSSS